MPMCALNRRLDFLSTAKPPPCPPRGLSFDCFFFVCDRQADVSGELGQRECVQQPACRLRSHLQQDRWVPPPTAFLAHVEHEFAPAHPGAEPGPINDHVRVE